MAKTDSLRHPVRVVGHFLSVHAGQRLLSRPPSRRMEEAAPMAETTYTPFQAGPTATDTHLVRPLRSGVGRLNSGRLVLGSLDLRP